MRSFLYDRHVDLGAKFGPFAGYLMPIQYTSVLQEHKAAREGVALFDVSHMGYLEIEGEGSSDLLEFLLSTNVANRLIGSAFYGVLCNEKGGAIDDVIVLRLENNHFGLVLNASNKKSDLEHIQSFSKKCKITPYFEAFGIVAVQGPSSLPLVDSIFSDAEQIPPMKFKHVSYKGYTLLLCTTGYTGERGYEVIGPKEAIIAFWDECIAKGAMPAGLASRDVLRLEMGYALYGHELSSEIAPTESVSSWTVKFSKDFLGKEALLALEASGDKRYPAALVLDSKMIARAGNEVYLEGEKIGVVTSGTFSPCLKQPIALGLLKKKLEVGQKVQIQVRDHLIDAQSVKLPFYRKENV